MKKQIKSMLVVISLLAAMPFAGLLYGEQASASSHIVTCPALDNTKVDKETCDKATETVAEYRLRQAENECQGVATAFDFNCDSDTNPIVSFLLVIINFLAVGVGIVVVMGIVWGSFMYITARGNASQAQQGISYIVNAVIGLVLFIFFYAIVNFLVPGGVFT